MKDYKNLIIAVVGVIVLVAAAVLLQSVPASSAWLWGLSNSGELLMPLIVAAALVDSLNPCSFSVLIISIIFLFSLRTEPKKMVLYSLLYIFGIFVAYLLIGLGILQALHVFNIPHFMSKVGAVVLAGLAAINILGGVFPRFPIKLGIPHSAHALMGKLTKTATAPAMFALGALVGLCEFPCTGGPYLIVLGLLHDTKTYWQGVGYLLIYNAVFILPLLAILAVAINRKVVEKVQRVQQSNKGSIKLIAGLLMLVLAYIVWIV